MNGLTDLATYGVVGLCIALVAYMAYKDNLRFKKDKMENNTLNNHLFHLDETLNKFNETLTKVGERIERCPSNK